MPLYIPDIPMPDLAAQTAVQERLQRLDTPAGGLGHLAGLAVRLAAMTGQSRLSFPRKGVVVMAADHAAAAAGFSLPEANRRLQHALDGRAAVNALARQAGATLTLVDIGLAAAGPKRAGLHSYRVAGGTRDMAQGPALSLPEVQDALTVGMNVAALEIAGGLDVLAVGAFERGGRLAAAALTAVIVGLPATDVLGTATGTNPVHIVERALEINQPDPNDPLDVLRCVGGLEIAGLAGVILGAAASRVPVVLDDFTTAAAALVASELAFQVRPYLLAGQRAAGRGHAAVLKRLGLRPLLDLNLHPGEGCGALLAFHLIEAAARVFAETAEKPE